MAKAKSSQSLGHPLTLSGVATSKGKGRKSCATVMMPGRCSILSNTTVKRVFPLVLLIQKGEDGTVPFIGTIFDTIKVGAGGYGTFAETWEGRA